MSNLLTGSERARLDPFVALADDGISMRDQRDLMSQPFFSLAKGRRTAPILYEAGGTGRGSRFSRARHGAGVFDNGRSNIRIEIGNFALGDFFEARRSSRCCLSEERKTRFRSRGPL